MSQAYADRDRVLEETRQLSERLGTLRQSLQGLLGSVAAPAEPYRSTPAPSSTPTTVLQEPTTGGADTTGGSAATTATLNVEGIASISQASEFMDEIARHDEVQSATLVSYEHEVLVLQLDHSPSLDINAMLRAEFADQVEVLEVRPDMLRLHYVA